ncbi:MAG: Zn-dependent hydrolase, partial [Neofamilia sp.]
MKLELQKNIDYIMKEFYPIGASTEGGVTRLGYSEVEDQMHNKFLEMAKSFGLNTEVDEVGNSYAYLGEFDKYHLMGSHLDSVINAGRYDGIVG